MALFRIYKRGQGKYSRAIGMASIGGLAVFGAFSLYEALQYGWFKEDWVVRRATLKFMPRNYWI